MGYLYGFLSVLLMSAGPVLSKFVVQSVSPLVGMTVNSSVSVLFFGALIFYEGSKVCLKASRYLIMAGILNGVGLLALYIALLQVQPATIGLINRLGIVIAMMLSFLFFQLRPKRIEIIFSMIAIGGAFGAVGNKVVSSEANGIIFALLSMISFVTSQFLLKKIVDNKNQSIILFHMNLWSLVLGIGMGLVYNESLIWPPHFQGWGVIIGTTLLGSCFGYLFYLKSLHILTFNMASILRATSPIFTALIALPFFGYELSLWQSASALILVFSVIFSAATNRRPGL